MKLFRCKWGLMVLVAGAVIGGAAFADKTTLEPMPGDPVANGLVSFTFDPGGFQYDDGFGNSNPLAFADPLYGLIDGTSAATNCFRPTSRPNRSTPYVADGMFFATVNNPDRKQLTIYATYDRLLPTGVTLKVRVGSYDTAIPSIPIAWENQLRDVGLIGAPLPIADNLNPKNLVQGTAPGGGYTFGLRYYVCLAPGATDTGGVTIAGTVTLTTN